MEFLLGKKKRCAYRPCPSTMVLNTSYFVFPKDPERAAAWLKACNRQDLLSKDPNSLHKNYVLCEKHFEDQYISHGGKRKHLFSEAIPTLFSHNIHLDDIQGNNLKHPLQKDSTMHLPVLAITDTSDSVESVLCEDANIKPAKTVIGSSSILSIDIPGPSNVQFDKPISPLLSPSIGIQTSATVGSGTPRKQKLRQKVKMLQKEIRKIIPEEYSSRGKGWTLEDFSEICDKFLSKPLAQIVKAQAILKNKKPIARRYSREYKQFALTLYFLGPKAYSFMSKLLYLPSKRSLQSITQKLVCKPGLENEAIFNALNIKVKTMLDLDKHCSLCIDEMAIKSNLFYNTGSDELVGLHDIGKGRKVFCYAKNALVIMARGLYSNWKQPIAYFFLNSQFQASLLRATLEDCVLKLTNVGLYVDVLVSDMGSNFIELASSLGVNPGHPEFMLAGVKIIYLYDICHLIKAIRNNLIKNNFSFEEKWTSWSFVEFFYKQDCKQFYRCAPKLTTSHIYPNNFEKMKVNLAVQILSHTVASGMNLYMSLGLLSNDALGTIEIIGKFNNLFDMLNSSSTDEKNEFKKVFEGNDFQNEYLDSMIVFFQNLKIINQKGEDVTSKSRFKKCWSITLNGLKNLWEKLSAVGFKYLKTKRLNTDCLENFFGGIRQQGGNCINPTAIQFERAFRKLFTLNYLHSKNMNCKDDLDALLVTLEVGNVFSSERENTLEAITIPDYSYRHEPIVVQNAFKYVCGYLLRKALNIHQCDTCIKFSKHCEELDITQLLTYFKAFDTEKSNYGGLRTPDEQFISYIYKLEKMFITKFEDICLSTGISHGFLKIMKDIHLNHPCSEFPHLYVLKLFIRLRIFYTVKYANQDLKNNKKDTNRKINILSHL